MVFAEVHEIAPSVQTSPVILPLLGARMSDNASFEYIPMSIRNGELVFAIPQWVVAPIVLHQSTVVDFNIGMGIGDRTYTKGVIIATEWDDALGCARYTAKIINPPALRHRGPYLEISDHSFYVTLTCPDDFTVKDLLISLLKDSMHLKKGLLVHLNHLIPYFSRITAAKIGSSRINTEIVNDLIQHVSEHLATLRGIYEKYRDDSRSIHDILRTLDLEDLRLASQSELHMDVLRGIFVPSSDVGTTKSPLPYLHAIRDLEQKLRSNYNHIVLMPLAMASTSRRQRQLSVA